MKILKSLLQISLISFVGILISCENNSDSYEIIEPAIQEPIDLSKDSLYISKNNPSTFELVDFKVTVNTNGKEIRDVYDSLTFAVSNINYVVDKDGIEVEPKKLEVTAIVPNWNGQVEVMKLYASNPNVINAITQYWEPDYTFKANGRLNFTSTTETYIEDVDFGEAIEKTRTRSISELLITGGSQSALEGEQAFDVEDLAQAMKARKARLEAQKAKDMNKVKGEMKTPAPTTSRLAGDDMGF